MDDSATPRNEFIMKLLMEEAQSKANAQQNEKLINLVQYYYAYYIKLGAIKDGNQGEYDRASDMFMELAEKEDSLSNVHLFLIVVFSWQRDV